MKSRNSQVKRARAKTPPLKGVTADGLNVGTKPHLHELREPVSFIRAGDNRDADNPDRPLTHQQFVLVHEYLIDLNFQAAMLRAGYKDTRNSSRLKVAPNVAKAIREALLERRDACRAAADKVLAQLVCMVDASIGDFLEWKGTSVTLKDSAKIPPEKRAMLAEVSKGERGGFRIKLHDKLGAIEKLMRHLGMYEKARQAPVKPADVTRATLLAVREGRLSAADAALDLDMAGIPIPESLRVLIVRQKATDDAPPDDGKYAVVTPEEMAEKRKRALEGIENPPNS